MVPTLSALDALYNNLLLLSIVSIVLRVVHARNEQRRTLLDGVVFVVVSSVSSREDDEETAG